MPDEKAALRKICLAARRDMTPVERSEASAKISRALTELSEVSDAKLVLAYAATQDEVATRDIIARLIDEGKRVAVPLIIGKQHMEAAEIKSPDELVPGKYGILTAKDGERAVVPPEEIDCALVPGAAFSRSGDRLGMGGGYYDAFLPRAKNARRIALAFSRQLVRAVPTGENDAGVDMIVTEEGTIRVRS